jgi:glutamate-1-semialdehyde 2,1-aminomutase
MEFTTSRAMQQKAHCLIPGGAHTYAKGDDQFPQLAPGFIARGKGSHVWDVDGNEFIEYGMGLRAVTLGHANEPVNAAAVEELARGINFTRPAAIELHAAEALLSFVPAAQMVKFTKDGSTATSAAVKLARAYTGRDMIALCAEHPFFSYDDWFIGGATPMTAGIPQSTIDLTLRFRYNNLESLAGLFAQHPGRIACVIMEAARNDEPAPGYLQSVIDLCHANGVLFILDEMITGFRWHNGGAQAYYGIEPDLSTFGKALGNGFAVSALVGKGEIMRLGGLHHDRERVFLLSTTHGAEGHALAAAIATMRIYAEEPVVEHLELQGGRLARGIAEAVRAHGLEGYVGLLGKSCNLVYYTRDAERKDSQAFRALMLQELIRRGVLAPSLVVSYSHTDLDIDRTVAAFDGALEIYRQALEHGIDGLLVGAPVKPVYRKFN